CGITRTGLPASHLTRNGREPIVKRQLSLAGDTLPLRIRLPDQDEASVVARGNAAQRVGLVAGIHEVEEVWLGRRLRSRGPCLDEACVGLDQECANVPALQLTGRHPEVACECVVYTGDGSVRPQLEVLDCRERLEQTA